MKNILFILPIILIVFISCDYNTKISHLEYENDMLRHDIIKKDSLYDSINNEYNTLKEKMTRHIKYVYTVTDEYIRDQNGDLWELDEFFREKYTNVDMVGMFDITHEDVEECNSSYEPYSGSDYEDDDDYTVREPRAL